MKGLMSNTAKSEVSCAVKNIQRLYMIKDCQSEPHYQHQNPIEHCIQDVKRMSNNIMDCVGCPTKFWLLCTLLTISLLNHLVNVNGAIPMSLITSQVTDISTFLTFHFWEEVFFEEPDSSERLGCWVRIAAKHGDALTYLVLSHDTEQVVVRSNVHHAKDPYFLTSVPARLPLLALRRWTEGRFHPGQSSIPCQMPLMSICPTSNCQNSHLMSSLDYHSSMILIMDSISEQR